MDLQGGNELFQAKRVLYAQEILLHMIFEIAVIPGYIEAVVWRIADSAPAREKAVRKIRNLRKGWGGMEDRLLVIH
jgi:hypothetical protein